MWATLLLTTSAPPSSDTRPPGFQVFEDQPAGSSAPPNSLPTVGWSCTSPSGPVSVSPTYVPLVVPAANSAVRESTSVLAGVVNEAAVPGDVAELPALSAELTL